MKSKNHIEIIMLEFHNSQHLLVCQTKLFFQKVNSSKTSNFHLLHYFYMLSSSPSHWTFFLCLGKFQPAKPTTNQEHKIGSFFQNNLDCSIRYIHFHHIHATFQQDKYRVTLSIEVQADKNKPPSVFALVGYKTQSPMMFISFIDHQATTLDARRNSDLFCFIPLVTQIPNFTAGDGESSPLG